MLIFQAYTNDKYNIIIRPMPERHSAAKKCEQQHFEDTSFIGGMLGHDAGPVSLAVQTQKNQLDFYEEYKRVLGIAYQITKQLKAHNVLKQQLVQKIDQLEENMETNNFKKSAECQKQREESKKRSRRMAEQIERKCRCTVEFCEKQYGSEGSLIQHIKLKHPQLYYAKTD